MKPHRVWAEIDLGAFQHNLGEIRARVGSGVELLLVVKADAYGHGAVALAKHAAAEGVRAFGVGTAAEALELRRAGIRNRILVLGTIVDEEAPECLAHGIELGVHSGDRCQMLAALGLKLGTHARVHLNVDTGMGRLGVLPERAPALLAEIHTAAGIELAGTMTHLAATAESDPCDGALQLAIFERVLDAARRLGLNVGWTHVGNSTAVFSSTFHGSAANGQGASRFDAVRPGIAAYGMLPRRLPGADRLRPVLALKSQVIFFKDLGAGSRVGYGGTWQATRPSRIATLPIGYNDGVPWRLGNCGQVLVRGRRAPIVGRVSMDYTTIDVTDIPGTEVGDVVTLIGRSGGPAESSGIRINETAGDDAPRDEITVEEVATRVGTIPYEITCSLGKRVTRVITPAPTRPRRVEARLGTSNSQSTAGSSSTGSGSTGPNATGSSSSGLSSTGSSSAASSNV